MNNNSISISKRNSKMHDIASFSLTPGCTCRHDAPCWKSHKCYATKGNYRFDNVKEAHARNYKLLRENPDSVFAQLKAHVFTVRFFRFHVAGDFYSYDYFCRVMKLATESPWCRFLAFTKSYEIANKYIDENGSLPENFTLIFSAWGKNWKFPNPHNLPTAEVVFRGETPDPTWYTCNGNCEDCACKGVGCWQLKPGETIYFDEH